MMQHHKFYQDLVSLSQVLTGFEVGGQISIDCFIYFLNIMGRSSKSVDCAQELCKKVSEFHTC